MDTKQPDPVAQECADYATSLRSTALVVKLEGRQPPVSFLRAAELFERAAARIADLAAAPVVLPEPDAVLRFERSTAGKENEMPIVVSCNWLPDGEYKLYTEQQVRALLAATPKPPAHEPLRCSCHTCWPIAADDPASTFMRFCPACGNKRCPKANDHRHACTGSNEPASPGAPTN